jgi:hypothetical protein
MISQRVKNEHTQSMTMRSTARAAQARGRAGIHLSSCGLRRAANWCLPGERQARFQPGRQDGIQYAQVSRTRDMHNVDPETLQQRGYWFEVSIEEWVELQVGINRKGVGAAG